jgi:hypothetical protein
VSLFTQMMLCYLFSLTVILGVIKELLRVFGKASGLITNIRKCSMTPIQCEEHIIVAAQQMLPCNVVPFPCKYLGLPVSVKKLPRSSFLELIDKVAAKLPGWKATNLNPAGRATLVKVVLTAIPIYHLIALRCPRWVIKAIDKIRRGFLWKGRTDIRGGHCVVGWSKVCRPISLGGLEIHTLEMMGWSLNLRWLWLQKTEGLGQILK